MKTAEDKYIANRDKNHDEQDRVPISDHNEIAVIHD